MEYAAVSATPSRFYTVAGPTVLPAVLVFDGKDVPSPGHPAPGGLKLAATDTWRVAVMQSHLGRVLLVNQHGNYLDLAPSFGTNCVHIEPVDEQHFKVCAITDPTRWTKWVVTGALRNYWHTGDEAIPEGVGAASGWLQFVDGQPKWTDANRQWPASGPAVLTLPVVGTHYTVGQCNSHGRGGVDAVSADGELFHVSSQLSQLPPGYAERADGTAIVAVSGDVAEFINSRDFQPAPKPKPEPQPKPKPDPKPEDEPMPELKDRLSVSMAVDAEFPELLERARSVFRRGVAEQNDAIKAEGERLRGDFVDQLAHTLNRLDKTDRWGRKARRAGDAGSVNDDALAYRLDDTNVSEKRLVDVVFGDDFLPGWHLVPASEGYINGQPNGYWHAPINRDLSAGEPEPTPKPKPDPKPTPTDDIVAALEAHTKAIAPVAPLLAEVIKTLFAMNEEQEAIVAKLTAVEGKVDAAAAKKAPRYTARILGMSTTLNPVEE